MVSKELHSTIVHLTFWSGDPDNLDAGLHPFRTAYTSAVKTSADLAHLQTYDQLATDSNLALQDIHTFQHVLKSEWPTSYLQLDTTLKSYHNLLVVLLKATHPYMLAYTMFLNLRNSISVQLGETFGNDRNKPAQFLRSVQLLTSVYWQSIDSLNAMEALVHPSPDFLHLLNTLRVQAWIPPVLPGAPFIMPSRTPPPVGPAPAPAPAPAHAPALASPARTSVANPSPIAEVQTAMNGRNFQLRLLLRNGIVAPETNNGTEVCLSYHSVNRCFRIVTARHPIAHWLELS